jgi:hypothetical protein
VKRKKERIKWIYIGIILCIAIIGFSILSLISQGILGQFIPQRELSSRPKYCDENGCIDESVVFRELPPYPKDFSEVDIMVENNRYPIAENFSKKIPDENYFKQPEFYPTWEDQGVPLYTPLKPGYRPGYVGVVGYGAYPGDIVVSPIEPGQNFLTVTYWHASWAVAKFQGMSLVVTYPTKGETMMGMFTVEQDPDVVRNYFDVEITPNTLLLDPTYPLFGPNWAQKVRIEVHVKENTPPGKYLIGISPTNPPKELESEWIREHRLKYTSVGTIGIGRPTYQIFVEVKESS